VLIYIYQQSSGSAWWEQNRNKLDRFDNLGVVFLDEASVQAIGRMARRSMRLQCTIADSQLWFGDGEQAIEIVPQVWKRPKQDS